MKSTSSHYSSVVVRSGLVAAQLLMLLGLTPLVQTSPALAATNQVTGVVFEDFNNNGTQDSGLTLNNAGSGQVGVAVDQGVGGVTVTAYDANGNPVGSTTSVAPSGAYTLSIPAGSYRIEFSGLPAGYVPGQHGASNGTSVQFSDGVSPANFGILQPGNYCQNNPEIFVNCYHFGASNTGNASQPALYSFPYNAGSNDPVNIPPYDVPAPTPRTIWSQIGTTWGLAWSRSSRRVFASAYFKKHAGFGPGVDGTLNNPDDPGTVYVIDPATNTVVNKFLVPNATTNAHDVNDFLNDTLLTGNAAWGAVGKTSLGGMALSSDESRLFVMNLENRTLYALDASTGAVVGNAPVPTSNVPLPSGTCAPGDVRPFAVEVHRGTGYIGLVCTAESTQVTSTLRAYVYTFDVTSLAISSAPVFQAALDYPRGVGNTDPSLPAPVPTESARWNPWSPTFRANPSGPPAGLWLTPIYPQPMLTSLAFDAAGNMVLGLRDRYGDQMGNEVPSNPAFPTTLMVGVVVGDQLRACGSPGAGWVLESNARCAGAGAGPQNDGQGPDGGEYYSSDEYMPFHEEVGMGTVNQVPGYPDVMAITINPININGTPDTTNDGGVRWFNNATGGFTKAYRVFNGQRAQGNLFGKAAGLGDLAVLCDEAPIELGNRVWNDTNNNGRQDPGELPIAGVNVGLYDGSGTLLNSTVTGLDGTYYFTATNPAGTARILPNTAYSIRVDTTQGALTGKSLTTPNSVAGGNGVPDTSNNAITDVRDSDAAQTGNFAIIPYTTGSAGATNHGLDFGFAVPPPAALGDYVWVDRNRNGIQDEPPSDGFNGLTVSLLQNGSVISTTSTADKNGSPGYYLFDNLPPGTYSVCFQIPSGYTVTPPNQGSDDALDSDADVTTGCTPTVTLQAGDRNLTIDMGLQLPPEQPAGLGDFVWHDLNRNGLQDAGEPGVSGVTVTLRNQAGTILDTRLTNASGYYSFTDLVPATYSVCFTAPQGYTFTLPNVGSNDAIDSDADMATGCTPQVTLAAGEFNPTLDAGLVSLLARLGDFVWSDLNKNGIQDAGEPGVPGVTVTLRDGANNVLSTTQTNSSGLYLFDNLQAGSYIVCFVLPAGYVFSPPNQGGNPALDSNADMVTGCASTVTLQAGETNLTIDAGIYQEVAAPALAVSLSGVPQNSSNCFTLQAGDLITYTAVVTNIGGVAATNVVVTNTLPANTLFVNGSSTPPPASTSATVITWNASALNPGQSATIQYSLRVTYTAAAPTAITNQVQAGASAASTVTSLPVSFPVGGCTAISLAAFTADLQNSGGVKVSWKTALESNTFGFYVLRSATGNRADAVRVNANIVEAKGGIALTEYTVVDTQGQSNSRYWLQEIENSGAQNEHGPIKVVGVTVQPRPQPQPQPQPVVNPVGGSLVAGGGVPVSSLQSPVAQPQSAQQTQPLQVAAQQPAQAQNQASQPQAAPAQQPAAVASPLNTTTQAQAQPQVANVTTASNAAVQPAQTSAAQPAQQPVAVAEVQGAQPAAQQSVVAQPAKNMQAVGAQDAVDVARGGQPASAPALTMTTQSASAQTSPWAPIAAAMTLIGLGAAGVFAVYRRRTMK